MFLALSNTVDAFCVKCWNVVFLNCRRSYVYVFTRLNDWLLGKVNLTLVQFYLWQLQIYQNSCRWHRDENMSGNSDCQEKNKIYVGSKLFDVQRPPMTCYIYLHVILKWVFFTCLPFDKNVVFPWELYVS